MHRSTGELDPELIVRVLHVIGPMTVGGAQTQLLGLVRAAHRSRWDATVCATSPGPMIDEFKAADVDVIELDRKRTVLGRVSQLRAIIRGGGYDVIHSNLWHPNAYARMAVAGHPRRPVVVISERNVETHRPLRLRLVDRTLATWTDVWVGNSEAVCEFIRRVHPAPPSAVVHIANAVDKAVFFPGASASAGPPLRVGSVGRLFDEKGFDVLIDAARVLVGGTDPLPIRVEIAGAGPLLGSLRARAAGLPVQFIGELGRGRPVAEFLRTLDVFVLPSTHREGRANVLLEALSCGVPTLATDIPGTAEAVGDGATLVPPGDARAMASGIRSLLGDRDAGRRALAHAAGIADFDSLADAYRRVFDDAMGRRMGVGADS